MKTKTLIASAVCALAFPAGAVANDTPPSPQKVATKACKSLRAGAETQAAFKGAFGKNPMRACKREQLARVQGEYKNASKECKASNEFTGKNRHGKCVSSKRKAAAQAFLRAQRNAAKTCKAWRNGDKPEGEEREFADAWGTKRNAYGKCVSAQAKEQGNGEEQQQTEEQSA
jgi:hypothetical protein